MILCEKKFKSVKFRILINCKIYPVGRRLFRISRKTGHRIRNFFGLKPPRDQDGANKKKFSQIGPAVPELLRHRQTDRQTKTLITL